MPEDDLIEDPEAGAEEVPDEEEVKPKRRLGLKKSPTTLNRYQEQVQRAMRVSFGEDEEEDK